MGSRRQQGLEPRQLPGEEGWGQPVLRGMVHFSPACQPLGQDRRLAARWGCVGESVSHRAPKIVLIFPLSGFILHSATQQGQALGTGLGSVSREASEWAGAQGRGFLRGLGEAACFVHSERPSRIMF